METKRTTSPFALAVLSEQINKSKTPTDEIGFAALSIEQSENGWCQLLPAGYFKAVDGRPHDVEGGHWYLDEETAQQLIVGLKARANPMVIDYEHQTLLADTNGKEAPASGWFQEAEWRESGLWIKPEWTPRAQAFIDGKEYKFLSAVFPYNTQTGKPISLHSAALTNTPGLDGLNSVALRSLHINKPSEKEDSLMDRKLLIKQLGLADDATDDQITAALKQLQDDKLSAE
ncbi:phage protease, partial [Marinomonas sp. S3726]|uniref:phage protease n=1 Tax=Marinomonas sp. S3726 TaxID=579484 RepID=UPI000ADD6B1D